MRTRDLDEAVEAVTRVYCPHTVEVRGRREDLDVGLEVTRSSHQAFVQLSYAVPVTIDAGDFPRLFLMMHCADGAASARQEHGETAWRNGQTLPFSAGLETQLRFDGAFVQRSIRLDVNRMETLCGRWLGEPLKHPLRFVLKPFSEEFERIWQHTLFYLGRCEVGGFPLSESARGVRRIPADSSAQASRTQLQRGSGAMAARAGAGAGPKG